MKRNFSAVLKMMTIDSLKIIAAMVAMSAVYAGLILFANDDVSYASSLASVMIIAGFSSIFFTESGVYQPLCMGFGCTRKAYYTAMQAFKVVSAVVLYAVVTALNLFLFKTVDLVTFMSATVGISIYLALFSGLELFGYLTRKWGRWGLIIMTGVCAVIGGFAGGMGLIHPELFAKAITSNYILIIVFLAVAVLCSAGTYLLCRKYSVRGQ